MTSEGSLVLRTITRVEIISSALLNGLVTLAQSPTIYQFPPPYSRFVVGYLPSLVTSDLFITSLCGHKEGLSNKCSF